MSVFAPVIILILSMLIQCSMQLTPGIFTIFYHSALGKTSLKKADNLSLSFILGVEVFVAVIFMSVYYVISFILVMTNLPSLFFWILSGIFFAETIMSFLCYFRRSSATALFIPRRAARNFSAHAGLARTRTDAFILGLFSGVPELVFTFPLFVAAVVMLFLLPSFASALVIIPYILIAIVPLFTIRTFFRAGHNLAHITRLRTYLKPYTRIGISLSYLLIAVFLIYLGVSNG